jgi:hypothetical protein
MVERVIRSATEEVVATLRRTNDDEGGATFAFTMLAAGFVARCEDRGNVTGWIPTRTARRLADRVLSLLAADYLARPDDYESELVVCTQCKTVEFDSSVRTSGIFSPKSHHPTLPYFPEGA